MEEKIPVAISACLTGQKVRYDGADKADPFLVKTWGKWLDYVPLCPEAGAGLGVPREPMELRGEPGSARAIGIETGTDYTDRIEEWATAKAGEIGELGLWGIILKSRSPSCGSDHVALRTGGATKPRGVGVFARVLADKLPLIPVTEEGKLSDPDERGRFAARMFLLKRWRDAVGEGRTRKTLIDFHTRNKLCLMAHSPEHYRVMGRIVACPEPTTLDERFDSYQTALLELLTHRATRARNVNVLEHIAGYFRKTVEDADRAELHEAIQAYREGVVPLSTPITLANHYARHHSSPYLARQYYLHPHPIEMKLRH